MFNGVFQNQAGRRLTHPPEVGRDDRNAVREDFFEGRFVVRDDAHVVAGPQPLRLEPLDEHDQIVFHEHDKYVARPQRIGLHIRDERGGDHLFSYRQQFR